MSEILAKHTQINTNRDNIDIMPQHVTQMIHATFTLFSWTDDILHQTLLLVLLANLHFSDWNSRSLQCKFNEMCRNWVGQGLHLHSVIEAWICNEQNCGFNNITFFYSFDYCQTTWNKQTNIQTETYPMHTTPQQQPPHLVLCNGLTCGPCRAIYWRYVA